MNEGILRLLLPEKSARRPTYGGNSDREIILPIVILLIAEKCDFFLVFALIYILL